MAGDEVMVADWPLPDTTSDDAGFWAAALRGELAIQACASCGRLRHPPRPMCPWCQSVEREWRVVSGRGRIWSVTIPHPPLLPAFMPYAPYNVIVVELDDDPTIRLVGNLVSGPGGAINELDPHTIDIGERVHAVFSRKADDCALVQWVRD